MYHLIKNLNKFYFILRMAKKKDKTKYALITIGILLAGLSFPLVLEAIIYDVLVSKKLTLLGYLKASGSCMLALIGFILAHRGFTGDWL